MKDFRTRAKEIEKQYDDMLKQAIDKEYKDMMAKQRAENYMSLKDGYKEKVKDTIVESVINQFKQRSKIGIAKYGVTLDRTDLSTLDWINHAQEEAMDFCLYLEKIKQEISK